MFATAGRRDSVWSVLVDNARRAAIASAGQRAWQQTQLACSLLRVMVWEEREWYEWYVTDEKIDQSPERLKGLSLTGISV